MTFLEILEKTLLQDERFIAEDGKVLKAKVYDAAMAMDEDLLHLLLSEQVLKDHFFKKVNDTFIFDKVEFTWVLNSREFLPDSYTMYKNKIGLVDSSGDLISQKQDVTLVWPYKDCVLEGGQTKDDEKRDEVFYNETLAPDQVTRLLYPKALTNAKRYSYAGNYDLTGKAVGGEGTVTYEETTEFLDDDNLIIKGNNLLALSSLLRRYEGKVKLIYIDPPYNTGNDSFGYNDRFNHSSWLTFIKNRLEIARKLLKENGSIWITLDETECHYLKVLVDEVFAKENYFGEIVWINNKQSKGYLDQISLHHNSILIYRKTDRFMINPLGRTEEDNINYSNPDNDPKGPWRSSDVRNSLWRPNLQYDITTPTGKIIKHPENGWRFSKSTFEKELLEGKIKFSEDETRIIRKIYLSEQQGRAVESVWYTDDVGTTREANSEIKNLFQYNAFSTPKPEKLLQRIIHIASDENDLILDFFMGSATTQAVALKMNRRFIGIEQMDYINTVSVPRLCKIIEGEQGGISKDVGWSGGGSFVYCELAERSETLMEGIQSAKDSDSILAILDEATERGLLRPSVLPDDIMKTREEFLELSLDEQRRLVMELLDKNKLYVNLCDMEDENMGLSESSKAFTRSFYNLDKDTEV